MTKAKTLFSLALLTLILFLNNLPLTGFADTDSVNLTVTPETTGVTHGQTIFVPIYLDRTLAYKGIGTTVSYDPALLKPIREQSQTADPNITISQPLTVNGKTVVRVSSFPGREIPALDVTKPLALLAFQTLEPGQDSPLEVTEAYLYGSQLEQLTVTKPQQPLLLNIAAIPVKSVQLDRQVLEMEKDSTARLNAAVLPKNASHKTVTWTSSNPRKVTVVDGLLTALDVTGAEGPVTITAQAGDLKAQCAVTVVYPPNVGYEVSLPQQRIGVVGEEIRIPLTVKNVNNITTFNAFDITLTYDPESVWISGVQSAETTELTVRDDQNGTVQILGYGKNQIMTADSGAQAFALTVIPTKGTSSQISLVNNARVDNSLNAVLYNASKAALKSEYSSTKIIIDKFYVTLPEGYEGDGFAVPLEPYTFTDTNADRAFYDYEFSGTMGSSDLADNQIIRNADGSFTIGAVSGNLDVKAARIGKKYDVVFGTDITGKPVGVDSPEHSKAQFGVDYQVKLDRETGFQYVVKLYIGGNYYDRMSAETYLIPGEDIRGDITFDVEKTFVGSGSETTSYSVTFQGTGAGDVQCSSTTVAYGDSYSFRLEKAFGYAYSVKYKMGDGRETVITPIDDRYTIDKVTGNLVITVEKNQETEGFSVEAEVYLKLDKQDQSRTMYLILIEGNLDDSKVYTYQEEGSEELQMYYSEAYDRWCILTISDGKLNLRDISSRISSRKGKVKVLNPAVYDVNMTDTLDANDAQLVYDMYNKKYDNFDRISIQRFLNADVDGNRKITVKDAAEVFGAIA